MKDDPKKKKTSTEDSEIREKARDRRGGKLIARKMRIEGKTLKEIALRTGVSAMQSKRDLDAALADLQAETMIQTEHYRSIQIARCEQTIAAHFPISLDPDDERCYPSASIVHRTEQQISKMMGTEAPMKTENQTEITGSPGPRLTLNVVSSGKPLSSHIPDGIKLETENPRRRRNPNETITNDSIRTR